MKCPMCSSELAEDHILNGQCDDCGNWNDDAVGCEIERKMQIHFTKHFLHQYNIFKLFDFGTEKLCPFYIKFNK